MKVRKVDFSPDEFLVGVAGMKPIDGHVYWVTCVLQMSSGGKPVSIDDPRLFSLIDARKPDIKASLTRLVSMGKLHLNDGELSNNRVRNEIKSAAKRIRTARENGANGGRPRKHSNGLGNPGGSGGDNQSGKLSPSPSPSPPSEDNTPVAPKGASKRKRKDIEYSHAFQQFMAVFPSRGEARNPWPPAYKAWLAAIERGGVPEEIIAAARIYAKNDAAGTKFSAQASTWLNQDDWKVKPVVDAPAPQAAEPPPDLKGWRLAFWKSEGETAYRSYIQPAKVSKSSDGTVHMALPSRFLVDWVRTHHAEKLQRFMTAEDPFISRVLIELVTPGKSEQTGEKAA